MKRLLRTTFLLLICFSWSCKSPQATRRSDRSVISVFHAGSLSVPLKNIAAAFEKENPGIKVQLEANGSLACVRKITELNQVCDLLALADYSLIDELLIPQYASWNMLFATNELCLAFTDNSRMADRVNSLNWFEILMDPDIRYGRSDPDSDPCGYRTVLAIKMAASLSRGGIDWRSLLDKDNRFIRGKETDLNALLESQTIDYMFTYRSVAVQHNFRYLHLPDSINLSNPDLDSWYAGAEVIVRGAGPGTTVTQTGASIIYGLTIPKSAQNPALAEKFIRFITDPERGRLIFEQSGQSFIEPRYSAKSHKY